jgi:thiamine monophosphate synthase
MIGFTPMVPKGSGPPAGPAMDSDVSQVEVLAIPVVVIGGEDMHCMTCDRCHCVVALSVMGAGR